MPFGNPVSGEHAQRDASLYFKYATGFYTHKQLAQDSGLSVGRVAQILRVERQKRGIDRTWRQKRCVICGAWRRGGVCRTCPPAGKTS